jgi:hypothetical protein
MQSNRTRCGNRLHPPCEEVEGVDVFAWPKLTVFGEAEFVGSAALVLENAAPALQAQHGLNEGGGVRVIAAITDTGPTICSAVAFCGSSKLG